MLLLEKALHFSKLDFQHENNKKGQLVLTVEHACGEMCQVTFQCSASTVLNNQIHYKFSGVSTQHLEVFSIKSVT